MSTMPLFGHKNILHTLIGLDSADFEAAVALCRKIDPNVQQRVSDVLRKCVIKHLAFSGPSYFGVRCLDLILR